MYCTSSLQHLGCFWPLLGDDYTFIPCPPVLAKLIWNLNRKVNWNFNCSIELTSRLTWCRRPRVASVAKPVVIWGHCPISSVLISRRIHFGGNFKLSSYYTPPVHILIDPRPRSFSHTAGSASKLDNTPGNAISPHREKKPSSVSFLINAAIQSMLVIWEPYMCHCRRLSLDQMIFSMRRSFLGP